MDFLVLSFQSAKKLVETHPREFNVISIGNRTVNPRLCKHHLHLKMADVKDWHVEERGKELKRKGIVVPNIAEILQAVNFSQKYKVDIIHCGFGISRSPAIGYAILRGNHVSKNTAIRKIKHEIPHAKPNQRIVRMTDELFG